MSGLTAGDLMVRLESDTINMDQLMSSLGEQTPPYTQGEQLPSFEEQQQQSQQQYRQRRGSYSALDQLSGRFQNPRRSFNDLASEQPSFHSQERVSSANLDTTSKSMHNHSARLSEGLCTFLNPSPPPHLLGGGNGTGNQDGLLPLQQLDLDLHPIIEGHQVGWSSAVPPGLFQGQPVGALGVQSWPPQWRQTSELSLNTPADASKSPLPSG